MERLAVKIWLWALILAGVSFSAHSQGYEPSAPWPCMRHDYRNSGCAEDIKPSQLPERDQVRFWSFQTGGPIFSTPVVSAVGTVFVGSADFNFYAIGPDGRLQWSFRTGRLIDSAAAIAADGKVLVPSGDGMVYALDARSGRELWRFAARNLKSGQVEMANWFEGNVSLTPQGLALAPNDDFCVYGLDSQGGLQFESCVRGMVWSAIPTDKDGRHFFCSLDMSCYGIDGSGQQLWKKGTWGVVSASPAIGPEGTVYITSFDAGLYALDPATGRERWRFKTRDHIYGSPAVAADGTIYIGGADGTMYALADRGNRPEMKWAYDTLDPIRSSPVVDGDGNIYFGNGDGKVFVLNPDGTRRWSIDLTESDRNDINASFALGRKAFYVAMQDGRVLQLPYDYCLRQAMRNDPRCSIDPGEELPASGRLVYFATPEGSSRLAGEIIGNVLPGNVISLRLLVRENNETLEAGLKKSSLQLELEPWFPHHLSVSMDRRFLNIVPDGFLDPERKYRIKVSGDYCRPGLKLLGQVWLSSGKRLGSFAAEMEFQTTEKLNAEGELKSLLATHLAFYQPTIFPSVAQIGMDDLNFIAVPVEKISGNKWLAWVMLAEPDQHGNYQIAPSNRVNFPATIRVENGLLLMEAREFAFDHAGDRFGFKLLRLSGRPAAHDEQPSVAGNCLYAEGKSLSMAGSFYNFPAFGTPLAGAAQIRNFELKRTVPDDFSVKDYRLQNGRLVVEYDNQAGLKSSEHQLSILLYERNSKQPLKLDYPKNIQHFSDASGSLKRTELKSSKICRAALHSRYRAVVFLDGAAIERIDL